jgi:hypothetical protein
MPLKVVLPISIGVELIDHHSAVLAPVSMQVSLSVPIKIETASYHSADYGFLPDSGAYYLSLPLNVSRKAHVDRNN